MSKEKFIHHKAWCFTIFMRGKESSSDGFTSVEAAEAGADLAMAEITSKAVGYAWQVEETKEGRWHIQGYLRFEKRRLFSKIVRELTFGGKFSPPHVEPAKAGRGKGGPEECDEANRRYCTKEESRVSSKSYTNLIIPTASNPMEGRTFLPWQQLIMEVIKQPSDPRLIYVLVDKKGGCGKSTFTKYLVRQHNAMVVTGKAADVLYAVGEAKRRGKEYPIYVFDLPRTVEGFVSYQAMEQLKNGLFFTGKYEGGMVDMTTTPHIFIMTNFDLDTSKMSADRWRIYNMTDEDYPEVRVSEFPKGDDKWGKPQTFSAVSLDTNAREPTTYPKAKPTDDLDFSRLYTGKRKHM